LPRHRTRRGGSSDRPRWRQSHRSGLPPGHRRHASRRRGRGLRRGAAVLGTAAAATRRGDCCCRRDGPMTTIERARIAWARAAGNRGHVATLYDAEYGDRVAGQVVVTVHGNRLLGGWIDGSTALLSDDLAQQVTGVRGRHRERLHLPDVVTAVLDRNGTLRIDFAAAGGYAR